ncbi:hypothetical protein AB833_06120 [Chromatiales bacterium (ex Bugula neritina AB1)]|nr:hypothetical protein AB833_06120 [Chromatiales bacterium (ex Bugula neritina AB1)]
MNLTLRQLRVFKTIVESGGFRKAAEALNTSQPALSKTIQSLEGAFGFPLLDRSTHTVEMTKAGEAFYARLGELFDLIDQIASDTVDVAAGQRGNLSITYTDFAILVQLPETIQAFRQQRPQVKIGVRFYPSPHQPAPARTVGQRAGLYRLYLALHGALATGAGLPADIERGTGGRGAGSPPTGRA